MEGGRDVHGVRFSYHARGLMGNGKWEFGKWDFILIILMFLSSQIYYSRSSLETGENNMNDQLLNQKLVLTSTTIETCLNTCFNTLFCYNNTVTGPNSARI